MAWLNKLHLLNTIKNDVTAIIYLLVHKTVFVVCRLVCIFRRVVRHLNAKSINLSSFLLSF